MHHALAHTHTLTETQADRHTCHALTDSFAHSAVSLGGIHAETNPKLNPAVNRSQSLALHSRLEYWMKLDVV